MTERTEHRDGRRPRAEEQLEAALATVRRLVDGLREQAHEQANWLHGVGGLLALDDAPAAREALDATDREQRARLDGIVARIGHHALAGLVLALAVTAARRGVRLTVSDDAALDGLPPAVGELDALALVGRLLEDAVDAVAPLDAERRWVLIALRAEGRRLRVVVVDGRAAPPTAPTELPGTSAALSVSSRPDGTTVSAVAPA